jgi:large subunit ribosomal protein L23
MKKVEEKNEMTINHAKSILLKPYITEKTFNLIEKENKLTFIVSDRSSKMDIINALMILYEVEADEVNTYRTIHGKKALLKFKQPEGARDLATTLGLV